MRYNKSWVSGLVEYQLNSVSIETQYSALELNIGIADLKYFQFPDTLSPDSVSNEFLKQLNATLATGRSYLTHEHQQYLIVKRKSDNPPEAKIN